jgi:crotonobetaine/carnitine-CoA ligase
VAFESRFGIRVQNGGFGQTECVPITICQPDEYANRRALGSAAPDLEMAVLDDEDTPVPVGDVGEVAIRPRHRYAMFDGYWGNAQATVANWRGLWHHTGDFGRIDSDGLLYFVDRKKDSIRRRGENVSSLELEAAINRHPKIAAAAVHAVPSELSESDIKACLVLVDRAHTTPQELFAYFAEELPYFAIPRYVEVLQELPINAVGRVMKYQLRERSVTEDTWDLETMGLVVDRAARRSGQSTLVTDSQN